MTNLAHLFMEISRDAENLKAELSKGADASNARLLEVLDQARLHCCNVSLRDMDAAVQHHVEDRLWEAHQRVNTRFRTNCRHLRDGGNARVVELRKLSKEYLSFIKSSQKYYRTYIGDLAHTYGGIAVLERIAQKFGRSDRPEQSPSQGQILTPTKEKVLRSCYRTLIQLGDLSRYRSAELSNGRPDWSHAVGYYDLARAVLPSCGTSHNQMSVIALANNDLFRATYFLFRAASTSEPSPQTEINLRKAFYKISHAWDQGELRANHPGDKGSSTVRLNAWYLRLVSKCYWGTSFSEHAELENEVIGHFNSELRDDTHDNILHRLVLTNIAAGNFAQQRFIDGGGKEEFMQSFIYFVRLNLRTATSIAKAFEAELKGFGEEEASKDASRRAAASSLAKSKTLPLLRLYSFWLLKSLSLMTSDLPFHGINALKADLWTAMASCLSTSASCFPAQDLPDVDYMLVEDSDTVAFEPLICDETRAVWEEEGILRREWFEVPSESRSEEVEMLSRVRSFLKTGLKIALKEFTPLNLDKKLGIFRHETGDADREIVVDTASPNQPLRAPKSPTADPLGQQGPDGQAASNPPNEDTEAERMVSDLVGVESSGPPLDPSRSIETLPDRNSPPTPHGIHSVPAPSNPWNAPKSSHVGSSASYPVASETANGTLAAARRTSQAAHGRHDSGSSRSAAASPSLAPGGPISRPSSQRQSPTSYQPNQGLEHPTYASMLASRNVPQFAPPSPSSSRPSTSDPNASSLQTPARSGLQNGPGNVLTSSSAPIHRPSPLHPPESVASRLVAPDHGRIPSTDLGGSRSLDGRSLNPSANLFAPKNDLWNRNGLGGLYSGSPDRNRRSSGSINTSAVPSSVPITPGHRPSVGLGNGTFDNTSPTTGTLTTNYGGSSIWSPQARSADNDGGWQAMRMSRNASGAGSGSGSNSMDMSTTPLRHVQNSAVDASGEALYRRYDVGVKENPAPGPRVTGGTASSTSGTRPVTRDRERDLGANNWRSNARPVSGDGMSRAATAWGHGG